MTEFEKLICFIKSEKERIETKNSYTKRSNSDPKWCPLEDYKEADHEAPA